MQPTSAREWAQIYIERGYAIEVFKKPIGKGEKGPRRTRYAISHKKDIPPTVNDPDACIALVAGPNDVCLDLDCHEAVVLSPAYLPKTKLISGRPGRERTHLWYEIDQNIEPKNPYNVPNSFPRSNFTDRGIQDKKRATILDVITRGGGHHARIVISPPSPYDDAPYVERAEWDEFGEATKINKDDLAKATRLLTSAVILARCWHEGQRNELTLGLSGALLRDGWSEDEIANFIGPIAIATEDTGLQSRLAQPQVTSKRIKNGESAYGWPTIAGIIGNERTELIRDWLVGPAKNVKGSKISQTTPAAVIDLMKSTLEELPMRYLTDTQEWASFTNNRWSIGHSAELDVEYLASRTVDLNRQQAKQTWKWRDVLDAVGQLKSQPEVRIDSELFDANRTVLSMANGLYDLEKDTFRPATVDDMITRQTPVPYEPHATCPNWLSQLEQTWPDDKVRAYVQRCVGYTLQGTQSERAFFLLYGLGRNGKSLFLRVLEHILGKSIVSGYARPLSPTAFSRTQLGEIHSGLSQLRSVRLVTVNEFPNRSMSADIIKSITGGETNTARELRQSVVQFAYQCKLWFTSNFKPGPSDSTDEAFWERMHPIECNQQFPKRGEDGWMPEPALIDVFMGEASGILNWMLEGYQAWRDEGLNPPESVKNTLEEYKVEVDLLQQFFEMDYLEFIPGERETLQRIWLLFDTWATASGYARQFRTQGRNNRDLKRSLEQKGFEVYNPYKQMVGSGKQTGGQTYVFGLHVAREPWQDA